MNDSITTRLRRWTHDVDAVPASDLMDEAAAEIERLRWRVMTLESAAKYADTMQRSRAGQKMSESDIPRAVCPVRDSSTNNDAATGEPGGSVEFSPGSSSDPINRNAERESPRGECGESSLRDVARPDTKGKVTGGPEHHISEAQIDALECVVEDGRIVGMSVYGHLRSLLVSLRPEWGEESDRPKPVKDDDSDRSKPVAPAVTVGGVDRPVSYAETDQNRIFYDTKRDTTQPRNGALSGCETVPDPDSRVWETPCTPPPYATPTQGSVQGDGSVRDSRNAKEPVAWANFYPDEEMVDFRREYVEQCSDEGEVVPLYRAPQTCPHVRGTVTQHCSLNFTLTDEEREAVESAYSRLTADAHYETVAATLRCLLERLS